MRQIQIKNEVLNIRSTTERALKILDKNNGAAMSSAFEFRSGPHGCSDYVQGDIGITVLTYYRDSIKSTPIWAIEYFKTHPKARVFRVVTPETYDRFDEIVKAIKREN